MTEPQKTIDTLALAGQVHGLITFAQVLAMTHSNPARLLAEFEAAEQVGLAKIETILAGEKLVRGYEDAMTRIRQAIKVALESSQDHGNG